MKLDDHFFVTAGFQGPSGAMGAAPFFQTRETVACFARQEVQLIAQGPRGARGLPGASGGASFIRVSGQPLSALKVVWEDASGAVRLLDYRDDAHIDLLSGITITAASSAGQEVTLQAGGVLDIAGLAMTPGRVWLGADGALTQTPPASGFYVLLGRAFAPNRMLIEIGDNIKFS